MMIQLGTCALCRGFLGIAVRACPHCGAELGRARKVLASLSMLVGGGAVSSTLMACYGGACVDDGTPPCGGDSIESDAGRTRADAQIGSEDGGFDATPDATGDGGGGDAALDAPRDAPSDG